MGISPSSLDDTSLKLFQSEEYPCSYLSDQVARSQMVLPIEVIDTSTYSTLINHGFRRNSYYVYRPSCAECRACISVRVRVKDFHLSRSQKRVLKNHTLRAKVVDIAFDEAHYQLYIRYQQARHPSDSVSLLTRSSYIDHIVKTKVDGFLVEFWDQNHLVMVALVDQVDDGLSAVYTFYETENLHKSYGVYGVLWQINQAKSMSLPYVYLGYWIEKSAKMAYKTNFRPLEYLNDGVWDDDKPEF